MSKILIVMEEVVKIIRFEPQHFARLHQSLCKYLNENTYDAKAFCYVLYLANQDTFYELSGRRRFQQVGLGDFLDIVDHAPYRPYKTIVHLYCSLEVLLESVKCSFLIEQDRIYIKRIDELMTRIELMFAKEHGIDIYGSETVYSICNHHLVPYDNEPDCCLMKDFQERQKLLRETNECTSCNACNRSRVEVISLNDTDDDDDDEEGNESDNTEDTDDFCEACPGCEHCYYIEE